MPSDHVASSPVPYTQRLLPQQPPYAAQPAYGPKAPPMAYTAAPTPLQHEAYAYSSHAAPYAQAPQRAPLPCALQTPASSFYGTYAAPHATHAYAGHADDAGEGKHPPAYGAGATAGPQHVPAAAHAGQVDLVKFNTVLAQTRDEMNAAIRKHRGVDALATTVTVLGSLGAIAAGVATGVAVLSGTFGALSGIGMPVAAAAALGGIGIGLAGLGLAAAAGATVRALNRRRLRNDPVMQEKLAALVDLQKALIAKGKAKPGLTQAEKQLLKNVTKLVGAAQGFKAHFKAQVAVAAITTGVTALSVFILALFCLAAQDGGGGGGGGGGGNDFFYFGNPIPNLSFGGGGSNNGLNPFVGAEGEVHLDAADARRWYDTLKQAPTPATATA